VVVRLAGLFFGRLPFSQADQQGIAPFAKLPFHARASSRAMPCATIALARSATSPARRDVASCPAKLHEHRQ
jgi:hypothetical protein